MTSEQNLPPQGDDDLDLDREWAEARTAAGFDDGPEPRRRPPGSDGEFAEVSPWVLLYTGFMLGPGATLLAALILMGRKIEWRGALFSVGVCGAAWSVIQAATFGLAGQWEAVHLQVLRTGGNFVVGLMLLGFLSRFTSAPMAHDRQTIINSVVLGVLLVAGYVSLPQDVLIWLGR